MSISRINPPLSVTAPEFTPGAPADIPLSESDSPSDSTLAPIRYDPALPARRVRHTLAPTVAPSVFAPAIVLPQATAPIASPTAPQATAPIASPTAIAPPTAPGPEPSSAPSAPRRPLSTSRVRPQLVTASPIVQSQESSRIAPSPALVAPRPSLPPPRLLTLPPLAERQTATGGPRRSTRERVPSERLRSRA